MDDEIEIQSLMPLSGQIPIPISTDNKLFLASTPQERQETLERIQQNNIPWLPIFLVPILAIGLFLLIQKLRNPSRTTML